MREATGYRDLICRVARKIPDGAADDIRPANARLIAAAPDMLETLQTVIAEARDLNANGDIKLGSEFFDMIQQTVAKATGE